MSGKGGGTFVRQLVTAAYAVFSSSQTGRLQVGEYEDAIKLNRRSNPSPSQVVPAHMSINILPATLTRPPLHNASQPCLSLSSIPRLSSTF
ncbi:hypothetical protein V9T40_014550 [Parthenolecanium corni]|uniref:Uncharacterized protein n=1 Tax=Parthenolecanium corni TaxID=536013 RepID=A0AAN9TGL1_9HEMI